MTVMIRRAKSSSARSRWTIAALGLVVSVAAVALWPLAATATHPEPKLPLTADIVQALAACNGSAGASIPTGTRGSTNVPPDRNNTSSSNEALLGTVQDLVIHANAEQDQKELTLDVSGSHNVFDGLLNSRSHAKVGGSWNQFRHAFEYGQRSVSGKVAFDLTGSNNCFSGPDPGVAGPPPDPPGTPKQVYENAPPAVPAGFPFFGDFDPDQDGNILEHFAPGSPAALAAMADPAPGPQYFVCGIPDPDGAGTAAATAPGCSGSGASAIMDRNVQGQQLERGLYFVTGRVKLSASNLNATLTVVSGQQLNVNGSFQGQGVNVFNPYTDAGGAIIGDLLFASQWDEAANLSGPSFPDGNPNNDSPNTDRAEDALKIEGSLSRFEGIIVATNGRTEVAGEQLDFRCPVMGDRVRVNGSKNYFNASGCVQQPSLLIQKTPDGGVTVNAGADATFTITVTNNGGGPANNVDIDDVFPGTGWAFDGSPTGLNPNPPDNDQCTLTQLANGTQLHCDVAVLGAGESVTIVVKRATTTADCAGDTGTGIRLDNGSLTTGQNGASDDALADADNNPQVNDPGHLFVRCPDVKVEKTPDEPNNDINAGSVAAFTITFTNLGPGPATGVGTKGPDHDVLPAGLTWSEMSGDPADKCEVVDNVLSCSAISLAAPNAGDTDEYSVTVSASTTAANCGELQNLVEITADGDTNPANNSNAANIDVICPDVKVEKSPDEPNNDVNAGGTATFTVKFTNLGPGAATGVGTKPPNHDPLPAGLTWAESGGDPDNRCQVVDNVLSCTGISLLAPNAGTTDEYSVSVSATTAAANCGSLTNLVEITADGDTNAANDSDPGEIDVLCGAIRINKNSLKDGTAVNTYGAEFSVTGPGITGSMSVTDDDSSAAPDEDAAVGRICISALQPGQTYTVNETKAPPGYGDAAQEDVTVVATAGDCSTANVNAATFTNPPLGEFIIDYNDLGSGETRANISCTGLSPDPDDLTPDAFDDNIEKYTKLPGGPAPGIAYSCTITIDP